MSRITSRYCASRLNSTGEPLIRSSIGGRDRVLEKKTARDFLGLTLILFFKVVLYVTVSECACSKSFYYAPIMALSSEYIVNKVCEYSGTLWI